MMNNSAYHRALQTAKIDENILGDIIDNCHRTIDWSVDMYFKTLKKSVRLFSEKVAKEDKLNFIDGFTGYLLNDTEVAQLINDIEDHINGEIMPDQEYPKVKFNKLAINISFQSLVAVVNEQRNTMKLVKEAEKAIGKFTGKTIMGMAPAVVPKELLARVDISKKVVKAFGFDAQGQSRYYKELVEKQINGLMQNINLKLKEELKYQLADQLYKWLDQQAVEQTKSVIN